MLLLTPRRVTRNIESDPRSMVSLGAVGAPDDLLIGCVNLTRVYRPARSQPLASRHGPR